MKAKTGKKKTSKKAGYDLRFCYVIQYSYEHDSQANFVDVYGSKEAMLEALAGDFSSERIEELLADGWFDYDSDDMTTGLITVKYSKNQLLRRTK